MVEVTGLGIFNYKQFFALVDAYPEDFPGDIILRLVEEQQQVIRSFMKRAVTDCTRNELLHLVEKQDEVIKMLEKKF
jgi:fatty acid/phospholipid biosynthesis enzyme